MRMAFGPVRDTRRAMRWRWICVLALLAATGCGASSAELKALADENARLRAELAKKPAAPDEPASERPLGDEVPLEGAPRGKGRSIDRDAWQHDPIGAMFVAWSETAKLGWADMRVAKVDSCGERHVGVQLEVKNRGSELMYLHRLERELRLVVGEEQRSHSWAFEDGCRRDDDKLEPGGVGRVWVTFVGSPKEAELARLTIDEPHGLARHHLTFGLRAGVAADVKARPAPEPRPAPPAKRIGEPVESRYYRVTALQKMVCAGPDDDGQVKMAVEVLVENFSNLPLRPTRVGDFRDPEGRVYSQAYLAFGGPCAQLMKETPIAPGEKLRGFISMVAVPADAKGLELHYHLRGADYRGTEVAMPIGDVPDPPPAPKPPPVPAAELAPATWVPPTSRSVAAPGLTVTVTDLKPCVKEKKDGKLWLGVEVLVHNQGNTQVTLASSPRVSDAKAYHYDRHWTPTQSSCTPNLPGELAPGQKARGWIGAFEVPVDATDLKLVLDTYRSQPQRRGWPRAQKAILTLPVGALKD